MARKEEQAPVSRRQEILGVLIMAFGILLFLGLVSRHPSDFPNSATPERVHNWLGIAGAWVSHYLFVYTIGYSNLVFPVLLFVLGWTLFLDKPLGPFFRLSVYLLALGVFLSTALAMPEVISAEDNRYGFQLSGLLGGFLAVQLHRYLGTAGGIIVLATFLIVFLISATSWSMRETVLYIKEAFTKVFPKKEPSESTQAQPARKKSAAAVPDEIDDEDAEPDSEEADENPIPVRAAQPKPRTIHIGNPSQQVPSQLKTTPSQPVSSSGSTAEYRLPPLDLLNPDMTSGLQVNRQALEEKAKFLEEKLREFDVLGEVVGIQPGPVITRFEIKPDAGVKISRFVSCQDDLALVMKASRVRVVAPIPGKDAVGIEIPNEKAAIVGLRSVLETKAFQQSPSKLTVALGHTIDGQPFAADLGQMPHLLVAGATGSGKSVCLNALITSVLYRALPTEVKFVLIDPKKLELSLYRKLKGHHLATREGMTEDVITTPDGAVSVLRSLEMEMEQRYRMLARAGVRKIEDYNTALKDGRITEEAGFKPLPYLVLVVDELADLMLTAAREIEEPIARLAQMSRAVGIHLVLATQRPSVDVITGVIKANFPCRIAFQVAQKTDSRTILDRNGAEKLLGQGDMLFLHPRQSEPIRLHGAFISTEEVQRVVDFIGEQPESETWLLPGTGGDSSGEFSADADRDELFHEAARLVIRHNQGSASLLQRRLRVGYARAGRLIDELEAAGILGPFDGSKARDVLVEEDYLERLDEMENLEREEMS